MSVPATEEGQKISAPFGTIVAEHESINYFRKWLLDHGRKWLAHFPLTRKRWDFFQEPLDGMVFAGGFGVGEKVVETRIIQH